jgi:hypothetical protein
VDAEHPRQAAVDQPAGDRLVGGDHEALDEQVGRPGRGGDHLLGDALHHLDRQLRLDAPGLDAAAAQPLHPQPGAGGAQPAQRLDDRRGTSSAGSPARTSAAVSYDRRTSERMRLA